MASDAKWSTRTVISGDGWFITLELVYMSSVVVCQNTSSCFTLPLMLYTHKHYTCGIMWQVARLSASNYCHSAVDCYWPLPSLFGYSLWAQWTPLDHTHTVEAVLTVITAWCGCWQHCMGLWCMYETSWRALEHTHVLVLKGIKNWCTNIILVFLIRMW